MKTYYIALFLIVITVSSFSQNKRFSVEANYPLALSNGIEKITGVADISFKYRFIKKEVVSVGASLTFDYLKSELPYNFSNLNRDYFFYHVNAFAEITIPGAEKLHPYVGAGFTYLMSDYEYLQSRNQLTTIGVEKRNESGFNLQFGIQYDITSALFVQSYFHYINTYVKTDFTDNKALSVNYDLIKFGLGVRF